MTNHPTLDNPRTIPLEDGALRIFEPEPDTDDRSRMYVLDLFEMGVIINVRLIADKSNPAGSRPKVVIETELWPLDAEVCGVESTYGQET